jgi:peptidoglycan/LPS O-acetylase OafA/YrhL
VEQLTSSAAISRAGKIDSLTGLRFIAAAMIVVHHSRALFGEPLRHFALNQGVAFFFVLSGFILTYVYPELPNRRALGRFFVARVARIWPAHAATFALTLALGLHAIAGGAPSNPTPVIAIGNLAMVHAWVPAKSWFFSFNAVSWSISTEFFFYLVFPLLIAGFARNWWWKALACGALLAGMIAFCTWLNPPRSIHALPDQVSRAGILYIGPLTRLAEFCLGMLTALLWKRRALPRKIHGGVATVFEAGAVGLCVGAIALLSMREDISRRVGEYWATYLHNAGAAPAFALLIFVFASQLGSLSKICGSAPMILLGEISFSVYLLHQLLLRWAYAHQELWRHFGQAPFQVVFWIVLLLASWAMWRWVEGPSRRALMRLASRSS